MISSVSEKNNGEANIFVCLMVFLRLHTGDNKVDGCGVCECGWKGGGEKVGKSQIFLLACHS